MKNSKKNDKISREKKNLQENKKNSKVREKFSEKQKPSQKNCKI